MAVYELKNDVISISMDSHGAELKSLKKLDTGKEYMWCGDAKYWGRTSPVLFPFVGGLKDKEYRTKGKAYPMNQHGFARDMEFELFSQSENEIWFILKPNEETLAKYCDPDTPEYAKMVEEIRKQLHFTSLRFHRLDDMLDSTGLPHEKLCTYCWNGKE